MSHTVDETERVGDIEADSGRETGAVPGTSLWQLIASQLEEEIDLRHADLIFLLCYFLAGLCDSSAYRAWKCFVSMQTGNTVFLGLGAAGELDGHPHGWLRSLVSISSFLLGSLMFSMARLIGPRKRRTLIGAFCIQGILIVLAAALLEANVIPNLVKPAVPVEPGSYLKLIPLALMAFQSAGQMACSRLLAFYEIPTTVLTSVYYDMIADPGLLDPITSNVNRNRRFTAVIGVVGGAIIGGWICKSTGGISASLWIAAVSKLCIAAGWWCWKGCPTMRPPGRDDVA